jgi:hypothetical protein
LLLNSSYSRQEIVVRSTDFDRTLMSAQSNLVGLYPVMNLTDNKVPIQPIPIHTVAISTDFVRFFLSKKRGVEYQLFSLVTWSK